MRPPIPKLDNLKSAGSSGCRVLLFRAWDLGLNVCTGVGVRASGYPDTNARKLERSKTCGSAPPPLPKRRDPGVEGHHCSTKLEFLPQILRLKPCP